MSGAVDATAGNDRDTALGHCGGGRCGIRSLAMLPREPVLPEHADSAGKHRLPEAAAPVGWCGSVDTGKQGSADDHHQFMHDREERREDAGKMFDIC